MGGTWFWLLAAVVAVYVVLDGFDLGAGALHTVLARTERERREMFAAIGPVWDGNEVFLIAAGASLFLAFPVVYASVFSGLYLPLMIVLWLLVGRGVAVEVRGIVDHPVWQGFWDRIFQVSSLLLCVSFGAALGNLVRGVPLDEEGRFFAPLWTDFRSTTGAVGVFDWYTTLVALLALAALAMHGAVWTAGKVRGALRERSLRATRVAWWAVLALTAVVTVATFRVQPQVPRRLHGAPWGDVFPALAVLGLVGVRWFSDRGADRRAFLSSAVYLVAMVGAAAFGIYPYVLPSSESADRGLTVSDAAGGERGLALALAWWIPGMLLACAWVGYVYFRHRGRVAAEGYGLSREAASDAPPTG
jgi:cytochrome d ubiquinol oxidase subunit II